MKGTGPPLGLSHQRRRLGGHSRQKPWRSRDKGDQRDGGEVEGLQLSIPTLEAPIVGMRSSLGPGIPRSCCAFAAIPRPIAWQSGLFRMQKAGPGRPAPGIGAVRHLADTPADLEPHLGANSRSLAHTGRALATSSWQHRSPFTPRDITRDEKNALRGLPHQGARHLPPCECRHQHPKTSIRLLKPLSSQSSAVQGSIGAAISAPALVAQVVRLPSSEPC